eukprot:TRINITY_DN88703_c0_g1_i1.p1 TRINITY_DN88703_c0_g1~~TRINITY_DN88703_c0_g1_i1.p1  ORF type:complete len:1092 (+),score=177.22 TRINITY_DN88703_c0_g1_i1:188-3463(+)
MSLCYVCKLERVEISRPGDKTACERCKQVLQAPRCKACGEPVRDARPDDPEPYHVLCCRCSSCRQVVTRETMRRLAGKILCNSCEGLFGHFFLPSKTAALTKPMPSQQNTQNLANPDLLDGLTRAFQSWDTDGSGSIEKEELGKVLTAIMPNAANREMTELLRVIDTNRNGVIEYSEFCEWICSENPLKLEDAFQRQIAALMREAGEAAEKALQTLSEVQIRSDGIYFVRKDGEACLATSSFRNIEELQLLILEPEEFLLKIECAEAGLIVSMNTGRTTLLAGTGSLFGPFEASTGFCIVGLMIKPLNDSQGDGCARDFVAGITLAPLPSATNYDVTSTLIFAAEQEYLRTLGELLSKTDTVLDVNAFGLGGATPLMHCAARGATGSMRMLLMKKALPNLEDVDGWTALTYASRCGSSGAVQALLEKGGAEHGDSGLALRHALQSRHNNVSRALLRAGLGPAGRGTFALEQFPLPQQCKLQMPVIHPPGGTSTTNIEVSFSTEDVGVQLLYTLDGRDPLEAGRRYKNAFLVCAPKTHVRVVAVKGKQRSLPAEATLVVCHCALPNEIVTGSFKARVFPAAADIFKDRLTPILQLNKSCIQFTNVAEPKPEGGRWLQATLKDTKPRHQLCIDQAFATIKAADKKKKFIDNIVSDIQKAVGETPSDVKIFAGSIVLDFEMSRSGAETLQKMLQDNSSWLLTAAKCRNSFKDAKLGVVESLGGRLSRKDFQATLEESLKSRSSKDPIFCLGSGDNGLVAMYSVGKSEANKLKKPFEQAVRKQLEDVEFVEVEAHPEELHISYVIRSLGPASKDGGKGSMQILADTELWQRLETQLVEQGINCNIEVVEEAKSQKVEQIEFRFSWEAAGKALATDAGAIQGLDVSCFVYADEDFVRVFYVRQDLEEKNAEIAPCTNIGKHLSRPTGNAMLEASSIGPSQGQVLRMDLNAFPHDVSDLYFVLTAGGADTLSSFVKPRLSVYDCERDTELCNIVVRSRIPGKAMVVCKATRYGNGWVLHSLGAASPGGTNDFEPLLRILNAEQDCRKHWERRKDLVELRVMNKCSRMTENSCSDLAKTLQGILRMPLPVFQIIVQFI